MERIKDEHDYFRAQVGHWAQSDKHDLILQHLVPIKQETPPPPPLPKLCSEGEMQFI